MGGGSSKETKAAGDTTGKKGGNPEPSVKKSKSKKKEETAATAASSSAGDVKANVESKSNKEDAGDVKANVDSKSNKEDATATAASASDATASAADVKIANPATNSTSTVANKDNTHTPKDADKIVVSPMEEAKTETAKPTDKIVVSPVEETKTEKAKPADKIVVSPVEEIKTETVKPAIISNDLKLEEAQTETAKPTIRSRDLKLTPGGAVMLADVHFTRAWRDALPSMAGKVIAITGTTSGTGYVAAMECARLGAHVLLLNRRKNAAAALSAVRGATAVEDWRKAKAEDLKGTNEKVLDVDCDLLSLDSVRAAAKQVSFVAGRLGGLDVLVLNAGSCASRGDTSDGYDDCLQANHLSHMLLLSLLFAKLETAATARGQSRVVFHTSGTRLIGKDKTLPGVVFQPSATRTWPSDWPGLANNDEGYRYGMSKAAIFACFWGLHQKLQKRKSKVRSLCANPGFAATSIFVKNVSPESINVVNQFFKSGAGQSDADGAMPLLACMLHPDANSGDFYSSDGSSPLTEDADTQMKGPPEKVTPTKWERAILDQGDRMWTDTYRGLGIPFDL